VAFAKQKLGPGRSKAIFEVASLATFRIKRLPKFLEAASA